MGSDLGASPDGVGGAGHPRVAFFHSHWSVGPQIQLGGSDYWRLAVPAAFLFERGWDVVFGRCIAQAEDGFFHVQTPDGDWLADRDVIVWQNWMGEGTPEAVLRAREAGQVVVSDLDDDYWRFPASHVAADGTSPELHPQFNREIYMEALKASSVITVSTPYLAGLVDSWGPTVRLVRNYVDLDAWPTRPPGDHVGWVGAVPWRGSDLEILRDTVVPWLRERDAFFYHGGDVPDSRSAAEILDYERVTTRKVLTVPFYPRLWDPLRVALCPVDLTHFGLAKSWCKPLEACARGIPFVASDHPEYRALGVGLIAKHPSDWAVYLDSLEDPSLYAAESERNRARAEELSMARNGHRWEELLLDAAALGTPRAPATPRVSSQAGKRKTMTVELDEEHEQKLSEIPSATTPAERRMALYFAANVWDGKRDVFENGPLLGGVTRALGTGMLCNEARSPGALLQTYDWFSLRQALDLSQDAFLQLVLAGYLTTDEVNEAHERGTFLPLFESLHRESDYAPLLRPHVGYLPGFPGDEPEGGEEVFALGEDREFSLLFVDGCKSWYGTKHWAREVLPRVPVGSHVLFQDFGQYTCFWLPALVGSLPGHLRLRSYVDHTYAYQLVSPIEALTVEDAFPDDPSDYDRDDYACVFGELTREAEGRGDRFAVASLSCQRAAALAYIGHEDEAREIIDGLLTKVEFVSIRNYLQNARVAPTYRPTGEPVLL